MADIADVMDALHTMAFNAVYVPPLPSTTTITGKDIEIGQGWPLAEDIDAALKAGTSLVSIYAVPSSTGSQPQIFDFDPKAIADPIHGLTVALVDNVVTFTGTSTATEYATIVVNNAKAYSHVSTAPEAASVVATALQQQIAADYPGTTVSGSAISVAGATRIIARIGAKVTVGQKIHRQRNEFRITVWAPNPYDRTMIARNIDLAVKRPVRITMPDTSSAIVTYMGSNMSDKEENAALYRRDLMYDVIFDTVDQYDGYEVTIVEVDSDPLPALFFAA